MTHILAIDQGTTSSRAILFDADMQPLYTAQHEFRQIYPHSGWVEHNVEEIWSSVVSVVQQALEESGVDMDDIAAMGITNQRETTIVWDRHSGEAVYNAIVWQDRRAAELCALLKAAGHEETVSAITGLLLDPYFSATKLKWVLDNVEGARARAEKGDLLFGTVDSFLVWRLTGGKVHATDATNAARTMLYDIHRGQWSVDLCKLLDIPIHMLPRVKNCADDFGQAKAYGGLPIRGIAGDQQAAGIGQACFTPGMMKSTYGTGCFALLNTGKTPVRSQNRLLTTIAYQFDGQPSYALEGSVYIAGAVVQWLRDSMGLIGDAQVTQAMAEAADPQQDVVIVPAFTGLGAPYWHSECRGGVFGLTRNSGPNEFAKAALQSVGFQTRDLLEAMRADWLNTDIEKLRVDGGMSANNYAMQFLSDICGAEVERPQILETTALGAAWLAGSSVGLYPAQAAFAQAWRCAQHFTPQAIEAAHYRRWKRAVKAVMQV